MDRHHESRKPMTRATNAHRVLAVVVIFGISLSVGCSKGGESTETEEPALTSCTPNACGPVPPVSPSACPPDKTVTTDCQANEAGVCGWQVKCVDRSSDCAENA